MADVHIVKVTLRSGQVQELGFETPERAAEAAAWVRSSEIALGATIADDFGHVFSVHADAVESCVAVDLRAESHMAVAVAVIRQEAQNRFNQEQQRRQQARAPLLVPGGPMPPGAPFVNGGRAA